MLPVRRRHFLFVLLAAMSPLSGLEIIGYAGLNIKFQPPGLRNVPKTATCQSRRDVIL